MTRIVRIDLAFDEVSFKLSGVLCISKFNPPVDNLRAALFVPNCLAPVLDSNLTRPQIARITRKTDVNSIEILKVF